MQQYPVTIEMAKEIIHTLYNRTEECDTFLAFEGESGVGKTQMVAQVANEMDHFDSEHRVLNVAHLNIEDMGIPNTEGDWLNFKFTPLFRPPRKKGQRVLLILDELNRVQNESIANFIMGMINERCLMGNQVPEYMSFIGTLNPNTEDYPETQDIMSDLAMKRRVNVYNLTFNVDITLSYFKNVVKMDERLYMFLRQNPEAILITGQRNCPRNFHKLHSDVLSRREWTSDDSSLMRALSAGYMDTVTLSNWVKFFEGSLEKFIRGTEILSNYPKVSRKIADHCNRNKIDLLTASANDVHSTIQGGFKFNKKVFANLEAFLLDIPKSIAYTFLTDVSQDPTYTDIAVMIFESKRLMELIDSGIA